MVYFDVPNIHTPNHNFLLGKPVPNSPYGLCGRKATLNFNGTDRFRAQELCGSGGVCPGVPVHNSPYGLFGRGVCPGFPVHNSPYPSLWMRCLSWVPRP